ncbi:TPA: phenylalanine--tRNA ligase subunit alpha [Candidatus Uhrbacteria bacterium]|nr:phenylalanine--tRNA ligase subunit alpha [Candidatus Uhrbacteria bacterium]
MENELRQLLAEAQGKLLLVKTLADLEVERIEVLGRKGKLAELLKGLAALSIEEKKTVGMAANEVKMGIEKAFAEAESRLSVAAASAKNESEWLDVTLPGIAPEVGHAHLTTQAIEDITNIFAHLGFVRSRHPEVDWDYYAFEAMNMPSDHPARDDWETFFVKGESGEVKTGAKGKMLLTPHTSNGQVREMEKGVFPIRMISIGKCFRRQADVRHLPMFYQFEGLVIDKKASVTELKGVCDYFAKHYFGPDRVTRLRPYHFRFTEPSFELDISCSVCGGSGLVDGVKCKLCKEGWLELGGAGMVHPNVIKAGGLDPDEYSGFAFGWGVERTMMMRAGLNIDDIRILYKNDLRFIRQF